MKFKNEPVLELTDRLTVLDILCTRKITGTDVSSFVLSLPLVKTVAQKNKKQYIVLLTQAIYVFSTSTYRA